jgi:hypothetical protein
VQIPQVLATDNELKPAGDPDINETQEGKPAEPGVLQH